MGGGGHPAPPHPFILQKCVLSRNEAAIENSKGLSFIFWFQNITHIFSGKVTKFQEKVLLFRSYDPQITEGGEKHPCSKRVDEFRRQVEISLFPRRHENPVCNMLCWD